MNFVKKAATATSLALALLVSGLVTAPAASAASPDCWSGYACLWQSTGFNGAKYGVSLNQGTLAGLAHDNNAESASGNGANCRTVFFYTSANRSWGNGQWYFYLGSQQLYAGYAWNDDNLNGVYEIGYSQPSSVYNYDFRNKVSSWRFSECG
jgi:hypothetical protein